MLRSGGLVAAAAPSREDSPELADVLSRGQLTFDAELAPEMFAESFAEVEVERWNAPLVELPTREAVRDYLVGKGVEPPRAAARAAAADVPLSVTKRGALVFGRKWSTFAPDPRFPRWARRSSRLTRRNARPPGRPQRSPIGRAGSARGAARA